MFYLYTLVHYRKVPFTRTAAVYGREIYPSRRLTLLVYTRPCVE